MMTGTNKNGTKRSLWQRIVSMLMAFVMVLSFVPTAAFGSMMTADAAGSATTLYLTPNSNWKVDGARFAAYFFGNGEKWVSMEECPNDPGVYRVDVPAGYPSVIFCRMNPGTAANSWDNKWNQTADLTVPTDGSNHYTVKDGTWDSGGGTWGTFTETPSVFNVTFNGTNLTISGAATATEGEAYTAVLTADEGYMLPDADGVTVKVGGTTMTGGNIDYVYNSGTGELTIPAAGVIGDIVITAEAKKISYTYTVHYKNANWSNVNAYAWVGAGTTLLGSWPGTAVADTDNDGWYTVTLNELDAREVKIIFNNGSAQTADLEVKIPDGSTSTEVWFVGSDNTAHTEKPADPAANFYTIAGSAELCGSGWNPADSNNKMALNAVTGLYEKVYTGVAEGDYEFKVVANGSWGNEWPASNYKLSVAADNSTVTITFNESTKAVNAVADAPAAHYSVTFNGTHVTSNGAPAALEGEAYAAALTADEGYTLPETVTVTVGGTAITDYSYNAETGALSIPANKVTGNIVITAVGVEEPDTITVYFRNDWLWTDVSVYYWGSTTGTNPTWPGIAMTKVDTAKDDNNNDRDVYAATVPADVTAIIFNGLKDDGSGNRDQTPDITAENIADGNAYTVYWDGGNFWKLIEYTPSSGGGEGGGDAAVDYYLIGYINGANYGFEEDYANLGDYKFVDGTLTATFEQDSYVFLKTGDNLGWFMTEAFCEATTGVFKNTDTGASEKMKVPGGKELTFTLVENPDGSLTLSYVTSVPSTYYVAGVEALCGSNWAADDPDNQMTLNAGSGLYEKVYSDVPAGDYEFKVTDGSWSNSWGANGGNASVTVDEDGSTVTVRFDDATKEITTEVTAPGAGDEDEKTDYTAIFHFANTIGWSPLNLYVWNDDGATLGSWPGTAVTQQDENGYYIMTVSYASASNKGVNYIFNNGSSQTVDLTLAADAFDSTTNTAEVWVELDPTPVSGKYELKQIDDEPLADVMLAVSPKVDGTDVTFAYVSDDTAASVEVRGTMNDWSAAGALQLQKVKTEGGKTLWSGTLQDLTPGVYAYKFVVNGSDWTADPANGNADADGNSVFTIVDPNAVDTNKVVINVYYDRADGIYEQANADGDATGIWNAYVWGDGIPGTRKDYAMDIADKNDDGVYDQMVFTLEVEGRATRQVCLKNRMSTPAKDWLREEAQVTIDLNNIVSGTINVYVTSDGQNGQKGNSSYSVVTDADIVLANKVTDVEYDYTAGKVIVTTLQPLTDPSELGVANVADAVDDVAITDVKASGTTYTLTLNKILPLGKLYQYKVLFGIKDAAAEKPAEKYYTYDIAVDAAYATDAFAEAFTYTGNDLGATYTADKTTFKVWAPTAESVRVELYKKGSDLEEGAAYLGGYDMEQDVNGTWAVSVDGDLDGVYYTYAVTVDGKTVEAVDPYARTTGVNGQRGMVIDLDSTDPADGWSEIADKPENYTDAVIYELHVRDFSIDDSSGVKDEWKGKFLGLTQSGTTTANGTTTGLDYLKDLGITHLHLLPIYDYGSVNETKCDTFNWGYDPVNYNTPEGSYSTNPYDGATRVREMKEMVDTLHENNIGVIMDVVYNHVYDADKFCFNNIVPGYFSRPNSNTSGCGNDTASEREMVRKYIVESVLYWAEEYHIDGFRFDLVGLLDVETINQIVTAVHAVRPDIVFYGEGWDMDSTNKEPDTEMAKQGNAGKTPGFAYFSDSMRNGIGGSNGHSTGFASGAGNGGSMVAEWKANPWWTSNPTQVVQYASCHDNYTLVDKLVLSTSASGLNSSIIRMNNLAAAFYMTAQGIPFIHAGEEFLREKLDENGVRCENSYNASDFVNHIEWSNLDNQTYADNSDYYKGLIEFRKAHPALRYASAADIADNVKNLTSEANLLVFRVDGEGAKAAGETDDILVVFNADRVAKSVTLPEGEWTICVNDTKAGTASLGTATGTASVPAVSAMVLTKANTGADANEPLGPSEEKTLYFSNNKGWSSVYAYAWTDDGETKLLGEWPGIAMTYVETNDYGEKIYSVTLPASATGVEGVIFHNNSGEQTVDIEPGVDGTGYYCTDKNGENKWEVGTYTYRAPALGGADEYYLVGYINGADYVGDAYQFVDGKVTMTLSVDSYVYVINGDNSETYMTDGYLGSVTSATLKDTSKYTSSQWDKLLIPGGGEMTVTMVKNSDNTITLSYQSEVPAFEDESGVQDGVTLHAWNWSFAQIEANMAQIAAQGFTAVQTSPVQALKEDTNLSTNSVGSHWWVYYQPVDFVITTDSGNALGTKAELESMIETAHQYGVKVIVDVVANHLGNKTGNDLADRIPEYLRKDAYWHDITKNITNWESREDMTQNCLTGLPDLNTANTEVQGYVLDFLKECVDIGVDGFRFDMAKSIETPDDNAAFASDFWPNVVGGIRDYADTTYSKDLYVYGEVLDDAKIAISAYTKYMSVTDNGWGNHLRTQIAAGSATLAEGYYKSADAANLVLWAESHDTYATDDASQSSANVSVANIHKTWALVAARADAMGLYLARPESMTQALGVASVTGWADPEVAEVNEFHNAFVGQSETIGNEGSISYVERGTTGAVLVNEAGTTAEISVTANAMADGSYLDQISGNTFTVANGKISGTIGETGIAVIYQPVSYDLTVNAGTGGTVTTSKDEPAVGDVVEITVTPAAGKDIAAVTVTDDAGNPVPVTKLSDNRYSFVQPAADVVITVSFADHLYTVQTGSNAGGTVAVDNPNPKLGDTVVFTVTPDEGMEVESVTVTDANGNPVQFSKVQRMLFALLRAADATVRYSYVQPDSDVTIAVTFRQVVVNPNPNPNPNPNQPDQPAAGTTGGSGSGNATGDSAPVALWLGSMAVACMAACCVLYARWKKEQDIEDEV